MLYHCQVSVRRFSFLLLWLLLLISIARKMNLSLRPCLLLFRIGIATQSVGILSRLSLGLSRMILAVVLAIHIPHLLVYRGWHPEA